MKKFDPINVLVLVVSSLIALAIASRAMGGQIDRVTMQVFDSGNKLQVEAWHDCGYELSGEVGYFKQDRLICVNYRLEPGRPHVSVSRSARVAEIGNLFRRWTKARRVLVRIEQPSGELLGSKSICRDSVGRSSEAWRAQSANLNSASAPGPRVNSYILPPPSAGRFELVRVPRWRVLYYDRFGPVYGMYYESAIIWRRY